MSGLPDRARDGVPMTDQQAFSPATKSAWRERIYRLFTWLASAGLRRADRHREFHRQLDEDCR